MFMEKLEQLENMIRQAVVCPIKILSASMKQHIFRVWIKCRWLCLKVIAKNCLNYKLGLENNKRQQRWISNISSNFKFTIKGLAIHLLYAESKAFWLVWKWSHDLKQSIRIHELKRIVNCSWNIFIGLGLFYLLSTICCNPCSSLSGFHNLANSCVGSRQRSQVHRHHEGVLQGRELRRLCSQKLRRQACGPQRGVVRDSSSLVRDAHLCCHD